MSYSIAASLKHRAPPGTLAKKAKSFDLKQEGSAPLRIAVAKCCDFYS